MHCLTGRDCGDFSGEHGNIADFFAVYSIYSEITIGKRKTGNRDAKSTWIQEKTNQTAVFYQIYSVVCVRGNNGLFAGLSALRATDKADAGVVWRTAVQLEVGYPFISGSICGGDNSFAFGFTYPEKVRGTYDTGSSVSRTGTEEKRYPEAVFAD